MPALSAYQAVGSQIVMKVRSSAALAFLFLLTACAGGGSAPSKVQDLGFWGLGWQFTAVQNRLQPAIPPILEFLKARYPRIAPAKVPSGFEQEFRGAILSAPGILQDRLDRRMIGAFAVSGLSCAAEAHPVISGEWAVGAFLVLDIASLEKPPEDWTPCPPAPPGEAGPRVPALRALISTLVNETAPKRLSDVR
jgi:hypothetical protein